MAGKFHNGKIKSIDNLPLCLRTPLPQRGKIADMETIGNSKAVRVYLREWREKRQLTQEQLASRMETTAGTISKKESEPSKVDVSWLNRFAQALDVGIEDLFHNPERPTPADLLRAAAAAVPEDRAIEAIDFLELYAKRRSANG